jgi:hypothetical protein
MLTLVWREIVDHAAHLVLAAVISAIAVTLLLLPFTLDVRGEMTVIVGIMIVASLFGFCILGVGQMYGDRAGRISSFLSTQAVTRGRILLARFLVGLLAIGIVLVPVGVTAIVDLAAFLPPITFYSRFLTAAYTTAFLTAFACYGLGLYAGWALPKQLLLFGALLLPATLISLVVIKGFVADTIGILVSLNLAVIVALALKFRSTPL